MTFLGVLLYIGLFGLRGMQLYIKRARPIYIFTNYKGVRRPYDIRGTSHGETYLY
jgi:hypothetical protein